MTDLKPDNVMIVADLTGPGGERTKLLDFGIAKVTEQGSTALVKTKTDQVMGTPTYMSPEQCEGAGNVDAKSDVYSLGVMLFEMLAGEPPFVAEGGGKVLGMHMFVDPPLLRETAPTVPVALCDLVQRLLVKTKAQRPTMRQVTSSLASLGEQNPLPKRAGDGDGVQTTDTILMLKSRPSTLGLSAAQTIRNSPRLRRMVVTGFGAVALTTGMVMLWIARPGHVDGQPQKPMHSILAQPVTAPSTALPAPDLGVATTSEIANPDSTGRLPTGTPPPSRAASPPGSLSRPTTPASTKSQQTSMPKATPSGKPKLPPAPVRTGVPLPD